MTKQSVFHVFLLITLCLLVAPAATAQDDLDEEAAWNGDTRFTVLVMGMDRRPGARDTLSVRTDAIILASIDPRTETIGLLHIPRDVYLASPYVQDEFYRVNTLVLEGEDRDEDLGPYFAMDTVQYNLGIYIDRYVMFDFEAFITLVDAVGGLQITTTYPIDDPTYPDMNYGYDPFYLPRGTHTLDGYDALRFARTRHGDNDYVRGQRQLQVITALHEQLTTSSTLPELIRQAPQLMAQVENNIYTDLTLADMLQLARYAVELEPEAVATGALDTDYLIPFALPDGTRVNIPDRSSLIYLMIDVFGPNYNR